ncbi:Major facilitator superfamily domain containing protein [Naviculisporaceae sp. PSN 640]
MPDTSALVVGSSRLFDEHQQLRYISKPTPDPKDPLHLFQWRKWLAIACLCLFGALALAGEHIIATLVPVFVLEYAGIDPRILGSLDITKSTTPGVVNLSPLETLSQLGGPPLYGVALLSSLPLLVNGIAGYMLVPLSIAIGRKPVLLLAGAMAWIGGLMAGLSHRLEPHLAARCLQGFGVGAVEALVPLIIQDMMFIHERNRAVASVVASQGLIIVALGIASPVIVVCCIWRDIYFITSGLAIFAWFMTIFCVPETRWVRSRAELAGEDVYPLEEQRMKKSGKVVLRSKIDVVRYGPRTAITEFGILHIPQLWRTGAGSVYETGRSTLYPNVLWAILVTSILVSIQGAVGQVASAVLIVAGWQFEKLGLAVLPLVLASPFVWFFGGWMADRISNVHARRKPDGAREPETHLLSLVLPLLAAVVGSVLFGYAGENIRVLSSVVVLGGIFLVGFGSMTAHTLFSVYLVESYPAFAGPVLVNVSSFRFIVGFAMSFKVTSWIQNSGFLRTFGYYSIALVLASLGLPVVYLYGKKIRAWTAGTLEGDLVAVGKDTNEVDQESQVVSLYTS